MLQVLQVWQVWQVLQVLQVSQVLQVLQVRCSGLLLTADGAVVLGEGEAEVLVDTCRVEGEQVLRTPKW